MKYPRPEVRNRWHTEFTAVSFLFYFVFPFDQLLYIVKNMCIYTRVCSVAIVYELLLLPNKTASETFLHKSGALRSVMTGYLSLWRRPGGDWTNTWLWTQYFTVFFSNKNSSSPSYVRIFFLIAFLEKAFIRNILCINYTI
jgi:hypothetical protein